MHVCVCLTLFNLYGLVNSFTSQSKLFIGDSTIPFFNSALLAFATSGSEHILKNEKSIILETLQRGVRKQRTDKCFCLERNIK